jgi:hypothetical protein
MSFANRLLLFYEESVACAATCADVLAVALVACEAVADLPCTARVAACLDTGASFTAVRAGRHRQLQHTMQQACYRVGCQMMQPLQDRYSFVLDLYGF